MRKKIIAKPKVLYGSKRQVGKSNIVIDKKLKAIEPGKRLSTNKKIYYEYRKNRSDLKGKRV